MEFSKPKVNLLKIKELAKEKNITLKELSDEVGITPTALSKIMRENSTKTTTLEKIAIKLKVPVSVFFNESSVSADSNSEISFLKQEISFLQDEILFLRKLLEKKCT